MTSDGSLSASTAQLAAGTATTKLTAPTTRTGITASATLDHSTVTTSLVDGFPAPPKYPAPSDRTTTTLRPVQRLTIGIWPLSRKATRSGKALLRVRCRGAGNSICRGRVNLYARGIKPRVGSARFRIPPGRAATRKIALSRRARRLLRRQGRLRLNAKARGRAGTNRATASRKFNLLRPQSSSLTR
jgi:hypothetical protein